jgi:hypothetical protein
MSNTASIQNDLDYILCSNCFKHLGLRIAANSLGDNNNSICPRCNSTNGAKLNASVSKRLIFDFFVWGSYNKAEKFGGAPRIQWNNKHVSEVTFDDECLNQDAKLLLSIVGGGLFYYAPRSWMLGDVTYLNNINDESQCNRLIETIFEQFPDKALAPDAMFFKIRKNPCNPSDKSEYDSPPNYTNCLGRFETISNPVLYASTDLNTCIHEAKIASEDDAYFSSLKPSRMLRMLNLCEIVDDGKNEFESIDIAVNLLLMSGSHSYPVTRKLALAAREKGYDGIIYPSFYSQLQNGWMPIETYYGISVRKFTQMHEYEKAKYIENYAFFGRPIEESKIHIAAINRALIKRISVDLVIGPVISDTDNANKSIP